MSITSNFVCCVALVLQSPVFFQSTEAGPPSRRKSHPILPKTSPSDPCIHINDWSDDEQKAAANKICGQAFLALDQNNANSCRGWRQPECRLLPGSSYRQCSCIITVCTLSGIISDEPRSFGGCALDRKTDRYFTEQVAPPSGLQQVLPGVESSMAGRAQSPYNLLNPGSLSGEGTSYGAKTATHTSARTSRGEGKRARKDSQHEAGPSKRKRARIEGKTFPCLVCENVYQTLNALNDHKKSHTEDLTCRTCKKQYSSKTNFTKHFKEVHMEKSTINLDLNEEPVKAKDSSRPFVCDFCGARYAWEKSLNSHMKRHDDPNSTTCTFCTPHRTFTMPSNYLAHLKAKHGDLYR